MDSPIVQSSAIVALVGAAAWLVRFVIEKVWRLTEAQQAYITNHMEHNTAALDKLTTAIELLTEVVRSK